MNRQIITINTDVRNDCDDEDDVDEDDDADVVDVHDNNGCDDCGLLMKERLLLVPFCVNDDILKG